ncbi:MAG: molybdopterin molybdotransferase MoeA [Candidatus Methanomethylicia archaeon]
MGIIGGGFKELIKVDDAVKLMEEAITHRIMEAEEIGIEEALGRINFEDIISPMNIPPFNRAAMDGYAVKAEDTNSASIKNPIILKVIGYVNVGETFEKRIDNGTAVEIATGAPLPEGADAIVPYEDTKRIGEYIEVYSPAYPGRNVSFIGEDIKVNEKVLLKGTIIRPWNIAVLASINITRIRVLRKFIAGILSTGSELVEPGQKLEEGKIVNSTKIMLKTLIVEDGGRPLDLGIVEDEEDEIRERIEKVIGECDMIITTGGTSVGKTDKTIEAIRKMGGRVIFHGVSMRPGKPTALAIIDGKPIIMLSGYPVAALTGYQNFVRKAIELMCGVKMPPQPRIMARMARRVASQLGSREYLRVKVVKRNGEYIAIPLRLTGSGLLSSITKATGMVIISEEEEGIEEGELVEIFLFKQVEEDEENIS